MDPIETKESGRGSLGSKALAALLGLALVGAVLFLGGDRPETAVHVPEDGEEEVATVALADGRPGGLAPTYDLPNLDHWRVDFWVARFDTVPAMRKKFEGFLERGGQWAPMILEKLDERGMPRDLLYLAMIESGFEPKAYSGAKASGMWQFIAETGKRYGLEIDRAVDERNDPVKATDAALDYLTELHDRFNSWYLAAAAYNTGEGRVGRIMRETFGREKARNEAEYYEIWDDLPAETRDYVPLMMAAARITKEPHKWDFEPMELDGHVWTEWEAEPATQLASIAERFDVDLSEIEMLNPHFKIGRTPNDRNYMVRLPESVDTDRLVAQTQ